MIRPSVKDSKGGVIALPAWHLAEAKPADGPSPVAAQVADQVSPWANREFRIGADLMPDPGSVTSCFWSKLAGPGKAVFSPADRLATAVTFDTPGDYLLRLTASMGRETVTRDIAAVVRTAPLDGWKLRKFGVGSAQATADFADPDGDGIANLMEYALMLDPSKPDVAGLPDPVFRNDTLSLTYKRPASAADVSYQVEWTEDLVTWHPEGVAEQVVITVGDMQIVRATAPKQESKPGRFLRLRVKGP